MLILHILATSLAYLYFHYHMFHYTAFVLQRNYIGWKEMLGTFLLNYIMFIVCSLCQFHLIVNWLMFLMLLYLEMRLLYHTTIKESALLSLLGCTLGLALNIFFRSFFAMLLDAPLSVFDNNIISIDIKIYPVLLGFLVAGLCFSLMEHRVPTKNVFLILCDHRNLFFLINLLGALYLYLSLNLIVYDIGEGAQIIKLWSMKSSVFVLVGEYLAVTLSYKMALINDYRRENERSAQILQEEKKREEQLRMIAVVDPLTGCLNQEEAMKHLKQALAQGLSFLLVFIDLNCLKQVNDEHGHEMGDCYLQAVSKALRLYAQKEESLFRYGGDEFILLYQKMSIKEAEKRMEAVQAELQERAKKLPFAMSISYGIVNNERYEDVETLIHKADMTMYKMKQKMKKARK